MSQSHQLAIPVVAHRPLPRPILPQGVADRFDIDLAWSPASNPSGEIYTRTPENPGSMWFVFNSYNVSDMLNVKVAIRFDQTSMEAVGVYAPSLAFSVEKTCIEVRPNRGEYSTGRANLAASKLHESGNTMTGSMSFPVVIPGEYWLDIGCENSEASYRYLGRLRPRAEEMFREGLIGPASIAILRMHSTATRTTVLYGATWNREEAGVLPNDLCLADGEELEYFGAKGWHFSRQTRYRSGQGSENFYELGSLEFPVGAEEISRPVLAVNGEELSC